jgi:hypothetical protein
MTSASETVARALAMTFAIYRRHQVQQLGFVAIKIALADDISSIHIPQVRVRQPVSLLLNLDVRICEANGTGAATSAYAYYNSTGWMYSECRI